MKKRCSKCKRSKPLKEFYKASWCVLGVRPDCIVCFLKRHQAYHRLYMKLFPHKRRNTILLYKYGISTKEYKRLLLLQKGKCKLCGRKPNGKKKILLVDHCHTTKKIRGLLCYNCNIGLGVFQDNITLLKNAINYLRKNG